MSFVQAIFMGIVQGLTEFLPVSSSGHLVFFESFFKGFRPPGIAYEVLLHGATLLAILIYFRRRISELLKGVFAKKGTAARKVILLLAVGTVPAACAGVLFKSGIESLFTSPRLVGAMWVVTAVLLFLGHIARRDERGFEQLGLKDAVLIGCAQALAIVPGISRSGATISVALMLGLRSGAAAEFSFLLAVPAILGALLLEAREMGGLMEAPYVCGAAAAFLSGLLAIYLLLSALRRKKLLYFALYCLVLGAVTLILL